jgi:putative endonuclease
LGGRNSSE